MVQSPSDKCRCFFPQFLPQIQGSEFRAEFRASSDHLVFRQLSTARCWSHRRVTRRCVELSRPAPTGVSLVLLPPNGRSAREEKNIQSRREDMDLTVCMTMDLPNVRGDGFRHASSRRSMKIQDFYEPTMKPCINHIFFASQSAKQCHKGFLKNKETKETSSLCGYAAALATAVSAEALSPIGPPAWTLEPSLRRLPRAPGHRSEWSSCRMQQWIVSHMV